MKRHLLFLFLFLAAAGGLYAQVPVTGTVTDAKTGETLIGVTVLLKGTSQGTTTDIDGNFKFAAGILNPATILVFSYIGYTPVEITVGASNKIDVKLTSASVMLDEMVVIGYGSIKKRNVLGAVSKVDSKELTKIPVATVDQALQGRAAGVQVTQNTGAPGEGVSVRIRGSGSINSSNNPLYIVDGIPTNDALNLLSPNDIESISVLKDASAAAIYGSRANNGVVLITTKKGAKGQAKVTYNGQFGYQVPVRLTPMVNTADYVTIYNEAATNDNAGLPEGLQRPLITPDQAAKFTDVNYLKELLQPAPTTTQELAISGGTETTNYLISTSYFNQKGIVSNTGYTRGTARIDLNSDVSKWLTIGMSMLAGISTTDIIGSSGDGAGGNGGSVVRYAFFRNPAIPIFFADGTTYVDRPAEYFGEQIYDSYLGDGYSPIGMAAYNENNRRDDSYLGKAYFKAKIFNGLTFTTNFGMDYRNSNTRRFDRTWGTESRIGNPNSLSVTNERISNWTLNNLLNYEKTVGSNNFSALLGFEAIKNNAKALSTTDMAFPIQQSDLIYIGNGTGIKTSSQGENNSSLASFFGRFGYDYKQTYYLSATVRRDGSSRFTGDNKWGNFYSFSGGVALKQMAFLKTVSWLENLKLRVGYGAIGNQEIGNYAYANIISPYYNYPFGGVAASGYAQSTLGNDNLKWETSYQYNGGVDVELWKGAFVFSLDYFYKVTENMLVPASNPPSVGYASPAWINSGSVLNNGVEFEATYRGAKADFTYSVGANITFLHNEVLKLDAPRSDALVETGTYATQTSVGQPIGSFYLLEMDGIFQNQTDILLSAFQGNSIKPGDVKFKDQNGDNRIDNLDRVNLGSAIPKFYGGLNLAASYKSFDVSMFFQGSYGNKIYVQINQDIEGFYRGFTVTQRYFDNRWTGDGTSDTQPRPAWTAKSNNARPSSRFLEDGSYARLKNLQFGYTIPKKALEVIGLSRVRVYVSGTNLITLTRYSGLDPEMTVSDNSKNEGDPAAGVDWGTYPSAMTLMFGMNINF
jgi:TonB-linked SusC/RagA family outer membrane protein